jgi:predicted AlkP superfamily pyrophosphatase or phosphodiesterase
MIVICLDGFRYDYLQKTNFLKKIMKKGIYGRVYHGFGYASEFSAITGKDVEGLGIITNNFIYRENGGLKFYNFFKFLGDSKKIRLLLDLVYNTKEFLIGNAQPKSIFSVPLSYSKYFDFLMRKNFFSQPISGNKTIFEVLRDKKIKVVGYMWPFIYENNKSHLDIFNIKKSTANTDDRTFKKSLELAKQNNQLSYFHFFSTDNLVHKLGTNSEETFNLVRKLDNFVEQLSKYSDSILIFSDHGMVDVKKTWDLWAEINNLGFVYGSDYVMFLDSTLARFWFKNKIAEDKIKELLEKSRRGEIINFRNLDIKKNFGDIIFQVNPGILILPNFYQDKSDKAMHGYSDKCKEEQGFYIYYKKGIKNKRKDIKISEIFNIINSNL